MLQLACLTFVQKNIKLFSFFSSSSVKNNFNSCIHTYIHIYTLFLNKIKISNARDNNLLTSSIQGNLLIPGNPPASFVLFKKKKNIASKNKREEKNSFRMPRPKTASQSNRAYAPHTLTFSTHLRKPRKHTFHAALFSISLVHRPQIRSKPVEFLPPSKNPPRPSNLAPSLILNPNRSRNHIWSKLGYDDPHRSHLTLPFLLLFCSTVPNAMHFSTVWPRYS